MLRKFGVLVLSFMILAPSVFAFGNDTRSRELKYKYQVQKEDAKSDMEGKILNLTPSGYMTVDEYEKMSEYKDKSNLEIQIPKFQIPSDFKYVPKPTYRIVKYNDPPGTVELSIGKQLYLKHLINAQGIVSPDYSMLVYPAVYYYTDSASVACDLFVIPLDSEGTNLSKILKANTAKKIPEPILSTDKSIDNYASFRTLTPVDFSVDGSKLLVKQKIGSREDGIWETSVFIYDFNNKVNYDLSEVRDAIVYFWQEYMDVNLDDKRWDIYPVGFDKNDAERIIVQGFAFTGEKPVFLGTWSIDWQGNQSRLITFNNNIKPVVSINGYKVIQDGIEPYEAVIKEEKVQKAESKQVRKNFKQQKKDAIRLIKEEYQYTVKGLKDDFKDDYRDYKKLRSLKGTTEDAQLQAAYKQYLIDQTNKDILKGEKLIEKRKKDIEKIDNKIENLYQQTGETSKTTPVVEDEKDFAGQ